MATTSEYNSHFEAYEMNNIGGGVFETQLYFDLNSLLIGNFTLEL